VRRPPIAIVLAVSLLAAPAYGDPTEADRAAATALFKEGKRLMEQKETAAACRKFEESQRLDPSGGTLLNLAICHEAEGKTATAWSELSGALSLARRDGREERVRLAEERIAALEPRLSKLVVLVPPTSDLAGLEIRRDRSVLGRAAWGAAIPIDPGEHVIEASAPGRRAFSQTLTIGATRETRTVTVPPLDLDEPPPLPPPSAPPPPPPPPTASAPPPAPPAPRPAARPNTLAYALLGVSGAGVVVGGLFGLRAISQKNVSDKTWTPTSCDASCADASSSAARAADVSTVAFALGLGAGVAGAYLLLATPDTSVTPAVGPGTAGVVLRRNF
jgi:hypothetical protein